MHEPLPQILIVDDEPDICEILKYNLESEGYIVDVTSSSEEALKLNLKKYNLFLLDVMMHGVSGYRLADELKKKHAITAPFIFITAKTSENDKLTGFSLGAEDFITKPFSVREVIARVKVVLRRSAQQEPEIEEVIAVSGMVLNTRQKRLLVDGIHEDLTPIEFRLLEMLMKAPGKIFERDRFLSRIWNDVHVTDRTVDVHMARLRKKMGRYGDLLISRKGYGYCLETE
jgi:two-component system, OmpR family, alkaline phosphatase synthesis response regulator PhoP